MVQAGLLRQLAGARHERDDPALLAVDRFDTGNGRLEAFEQLGGLDLALVVRLDRVVVLVPLPHLAEELLAPLALVPPVAGVERFAVALHQLLVQLAFERVAVVQRRLGLRYLVLAVERMDRRDDARLEGQLRAAFVLVEQAVGRPLHDVADRGRGPGTGLLLEGCRMRRRGQHDAGQDC